MKELNERIKNKMQNIPVKQNKDEMLQIVQFLCLKPFLHLCVKVVLKCN